MDEQKARLTIVCLSHLALDRQLFQRPQQIMLQFAKQGHLVIYIGCVGWKRSLELWRNDQGSGKFGPLCYEANPYSPFGGKGSLIGRLHLHKRLKRIRTELTRPLCKVCSRLPLESSETTVLWIYHPDLAQFADVFVPDLLVYDVMDRFRHFRNSTAGIRRAEEFAYRRADLLFAGGRSLAEAVQSDLESLGIQKHVHCYPSAVDFEHFGKALSEETLIPADLQSLPKPILGYFGAVDERIDLELVKESAKLRPQWSYVFVGPLLFTPTDMPANVHFLGARPYDELPAYLKGFDICLLPFSRSELVAHISPTKTPEYLAGGKAVISTSVPDVVRDYGDVVAIVGSPDELVRAAEMFIVNPPAPRDLQSAAIQKSRTWEALAKAMESHIWQATNNNFSKAKH
ncbi:MAG: glycosyltransferase [Candidatus Sumerlaeaceae bacterium]|nr:glycosyltransferase [Candidatus Sumerlaeaceae bacterium]